MSDNNHRIRQSQEQKAPAMHFSAAIQGFDENTRENMKRNEHPTHAWRNLHLRSAPPEVTTAAALPHPVPTGRPVVHIPPRPQDTAVILEHLRRRRLQMTTRPRPLSPRSSEQRRILEHIGIRPSGHEPSESRRRLEESRRLRHFVNEPYEPRRLEEPRRMRFSPFEPRRAICDGRYGPYSPIFDIHLLNDDDNDTHPVVPPRRLYTPRSSNRNFSRADSSTDQLSTAQRTRHTISAAVADGSSAIARAFVGGGGGGDALAPRQQRQQLRQQVLQSVHTNAHRMDADWRGGVRSSEEWDLGSVRKSE